MNLKYENFINNKYLTETAAYKMAGERNIPGYKVKGKLKEDLVFEYIRKYGCNYNQVSGELLPDNIGISNEIEREIRSSREEEILLSMNIDYDKEMEIMITKDGSLVIGFDRVSYKQKERLYNLGYLIINEKLQKKYILENFDIEEFLIISNMIRMEKKYEYFNTKIFLENLLFIMNKFNKKNFEKNNFDGNRKYEFERLKSNVSEILEGINKNDIRNVFLKSILKEENII